MKHASDTLVDQIAVSWDGRDGSFLTRTEGVSSGDEQIRRILRAFPIIGAWDDAFVMAACAVRRINCGMDMRTFSFHATEPVVTIQDGGDDEISIGEQPFYRLLVRLFKLMIAEAEQSRLKIRRDENWKRFVDDTATLEGRLVTE